MKTNSSIQKMRDEMLKYKGMEVVPIKIESVIFPECKKILESSGMQTNEWFIRLGIEVDLLNPNKMRKTVYPIFHTEFNKNNDVLQPDVNSGVAFVIRKDKFQYWQGTRIGHGMNFTKMLSVAIDRRKFVDEQVTKFIQDNDLNKMVTFKDELIDGTQLVNFCMQHDVAYDCRTGCEKCKSINSSNLSHEENTELGSDLEKFQKEFNNKRLDNDTSD